MIKVNEDINYRECKSVIQIKQATKSDAQRMRS